MTIYSFYFSICGNTKRYSRRLRLVLASIALIALSGCGILIERGPLTFKRHDLAFNCYSAKDMKVFYANRLYKDCESRFVRQKTPRDDKDLYSSVMSSNRAFEGQLIVEWRSLDEEFHSEALDLDEIFKGRIVIHDVDPKLIYWPAPFGSLNPTIVIEVNNRTLSLYMDVHIILESKDADLIKRSVKRVHNLTYTKLF